MLLPSAFACDNAATAMRPRRPQIQSFIPYAPQPETPPHPKPSKTSQLVASCRALQSMLGNAIPSPRLLSPRLLTSTPKKEARNPFEVAFTQQNNKVAKKAPPPRGANKRRRSDWDDDSDDENEKENNIQRHGYSTPKRQRRIPYDMPLGLCAEDFKALELPAVNVEMPQIPPPPPPASPDQSSDRDSGYGPSPILPVAPERGEKWSIDDDRILVETVLEKLQLTKRAWNDCARRLGKDKDSLGRRWKILVDEGDIGLRRGGRRKRMDLDAGSW